MNKKLPSEIEVDALHAALYELYRGKSTDQLQIARIWNRIYQLTDEIDSEVS